MRLTCEKTTQEIIQSKLSDSMRKKIEKQVRETFGDGETRVAVRSSAVGEDGEEMSAAGQMDTFLGLKTKDEVNNF